VYVRHVDSSTSIGCHCVRHSGVCQRRQTLGEYLYLFLLSLMFLPPLTFFCSVSGVEDEQHCDHQDQFRFRPVVFYFQIKYKVDNILTKDTSLRINLNIDGDPIVSLPSP
jgi:hypothetical protein